MSAAVRRGSPWRLPSRIQSQLCCAWLLLCWLPADVGATIRVDVAGPQGERAGLQAGDELLGWTDVDGQRRPVLDPLDWLVAQQELAGGGDLAIVIVRESAEQQLRMPGPDWSWQLQWVDAVETEGADMDSAQDAATEAASREAWAALIRARTAGATQAWVEAHEAVTQAQQARPELADRIAVEALRLLEGDPDRRRSLALAQRLRQDLRQQRANGLRAAQGELAVAKIQFLLRDYPATQLAIDAALTHLEAHPRHALLAQALELRGSIAYRRGDNAAALTDFDAAAELLGALFPHSLAYAQAQGRRGAVALSRGEFAFAEKLFDEAISAAERAAGPSSVLGRLHFNASLGAFERRRLALAEVHAERALALFGELAPGSQEQAMARSQLAEVLSKRGEEKRSEALKRDALAQALAVDPKSFESLAIRLELAYSLRGLMRIDEARSEIAQVLAQEDLTRPEAIFLDARALLGELELDAGHAELAAAEFGAIISGYRERNRLLPLSGALLGLARAEYAQGRLDAVDGPMNEALTLRQRIAPDTTLEGEVHFAIARLSRQRGEVEPALASYRRAIECLERHRDYIGGAEESRARWAARYADYYREPALWLLELERPGDAWEWIEAYRAREFLAQLGERQRSLLDDLPESVKRAGEQLSEDYLRQQKRAAAGEAGVELPMAGLIAWRDQLERAAPRLAALRQLASAVEVAAELPDDALLLSYLVSDEQAWVVLLSPGETGVRALRLPTDGRALTRDIAALNLLLLRPDGPDVSRRALDERALALYRQLVEPALADQRIPRRLLIVPDGPLHKLPFMALAISPDPSTPPRYLIQSSAISQMASASSWLQQSRSARSPLALDLVALAASPGNGANASAADAGIGPAQRSAQLADLPAARAEAQRIGALFAGSSRIHLDDAATVVAAQQALLESQRTHFASHALLDPNDPLAAWLQLSPGAGDDGRLSALAVMRGPALHSQLVTLSACDSAAGALIGGEGLLGLARAFQYAGVAAVVGSLWRVADAPTQRLMESFYGHLRAGQPVDLALQQAQRELLERPPSAWQRWWSRASDHSHPYYWAAFVALGSVSGEAR